MKKYLLSFILACTCFALSAQQDTNEIARVSNLVERITAKSLVIPLGQKVENESLEGVWQLCDIIEQKDKEYCVILLQPRLKLLSSDKTFMNISTGSDRVKAGISAKGKYEKTSNKTYVEILGANAPAPFKEGMKNEITFEFLNDNLLKLTFMIPGQNRLWVEYLYRIS